MNDDIVLSGIPLCRYAFSALYKRIPGDIMERWHKHIRIRFLAGICLFCEPSSFHLVSSAPTYLPVVAYMRGLIPGSRRLAVSKVAPVSITLSRK